MYTVNFIAATEKVNRIENNQVVNVTTNSRNSKISAITYLDLQKKDIDTLNRCSTIRLELFTAGQYSSGEIVATDCYHTRLFKFDTMVPTTHAHLLNFRYKDDNLYEYFTVVNKQTNQIIEAGFIERDFFGLGTGANIVIDQPDLNRDQNIMFRKVNVHR